MTRVAERVMKRSQRWRGAVITGAASGIGRALALELAADGVPLVLADIDVDGADETAARTRARGADTTVIRCDVSDAEQVAALARRAEVTLPFVDLVCNNAGVLVAGAMAELSLDDYRRVFDVNLWGVIHGCHAFAPAMVARGRGTILNTASLAGTLSLPRMGAYSATKAAVISLSQTLAAELAGTGVSVTALCPSFVASGFVRSSSGPASDATLKLGNALVGRLGATPRRVARVALEAAERGELYAVPTVHGRMAWRAARLAPAGFVRAMASLSRVTPG